MSILNVNKINPVGGGSTITIAGIASVTNAVSVGNSVTATSFHGDGSQLTGISVDSTKIETGNTKVETIDTGSDGHVKVTTEGGERLRITSSGSVGVNNTSPSQAKLVVQSGSGTQIAAIKDNTGASISLGGVSQPRVLLEASASASDFIVYTAGGSSYGSASWSEKLRINSTGHITTPSNPGFFARPPANYNMSGDQIIGGTWSTSDPEAFVRGTLANGTSIWNNSTGIFTVPVTGIYYIHWNVFLKNNTTRRDAMIYRNGTSSSTIIARTEIGEPNGTTGTNKNVSVTAVVSLSVNDAIRFGALTTGGTQIYSTAKPWSYACAYLVG